MTIYCEDSDLLELVKYIMTYFNYTYIITSHGYRSNGRGPNKSGIIAFHHNSHSNRIEQDLVFNYAQDITIRTLSDVFQLLIKLRCLHVV